MKPGATVTVINKSSSFVGCTGIVKETDSTRQRCYVKFNEAPVTVWFWMDELSVVTEEASR